jgi:hypothetical protein
MTMNFTLKQLAVLLGLRDRTLADTWRTRPGILTPEEDAEVPLWSAEQVREMIHTLPVGDSRTPPNWRDDELLTINQVSALHNPPIKAKTYGNYVRRTLQRQVDGHDVSKLAPLPDKVILGHPLWKPEHIRDYLHNRPGPAYFMPGDSTNRYRGGRKPGVRPLANRVQDPEATAEPLPLEPATV